MILPKFARIVTGLALIGCIKVGKSQHCDSANYTLVDEPRRSTMSIYDPSVDIALCDDVLQEDKWFRFDSQAGDSIPERESNDSVGANRCGTEAPIYIRGLGSHPTVDRTTTNATVCATYSSTACQWTETIQIHRCPTQGTEKGYFLYKLKAPNGCSIAYCAGEGVPCNRGDYWTGFQCVNYFPPMSGFPVFNGPLTNGSQADFTREVYFTCAVQYSRRANDTNARFRVTFLFDGLPLEDVSVTGSRRLPSVILRADDNNKVVALSEYYMKGRLGKEISCKVESYWEGYAPNGNSTMISSNRYYVAFQSEESSYTFYYSSGSTFTINFLSTIPLTCNHCTVNNSNSCCQYDFRMNGTAASSCYVRWKTIGSTTASASVYLLPGQSQSTARYELIFRPYTGDEVSTQGNGSLWRSYVVPPVKFEVIPSSVSYKTCWSYTDPDIYTFDSQSFRLPLVGDFKFVSAKNAQQLMEIQVRLETCDIGSCACGIIIREGNSAYKISMCENGRAATYRTPSVVRLLSQDPVDSSSLYRDGSGTQFSVRMPSGLRVEINVYSYFYITANIPPVYHGKTDSSTLCGNSNGNLYDDLSSNFETFRINDQENYFKIQPQCSSIYNPEVQSCDCGSNAGSPVFQCSNADPLLRYVSQAQEFLPDRWTSGVVCRQTGASLVSQLAADSLAEENDFILDPEILFPPYTYDPNYGMNVSYTWPTATGKSEGDAERYCIGVFQSSAVYSDCSSTTNISSLVETCKTDVQETDQYLPATVYVQVLEEICINAISSEINSSDVNDNSSYSSLMAVRNKICPNQCSNRGNCVEGNCNCNQGYVGADCSIEAGVPPTLSGVMNGDVCDAQSRPCQVISVIGTGVVSTAAIKCRFHDKDTNQYSETMGTFITGGEFSCPVPTTSTHRRKRRSIDTTSSTALSQLTVQLTTDGVNYSNPIPFSIYDSQCIECSDANSCKQKTDSCNIQNQCFSSNAVNAEDPCLKCVPSMSKTSWANITTLESWQQCSRSCDYGSQARNTVCGTTVKQSELQLCKSSDCPEILEEKTEGVGITLPQDDLPKILLEPSTTLKAFADIINDHCARNGSGCCYSIGKTYANVETVTFTSADLVRYASGYPETENLPDARVKIIVRINLPLVESKCTGTTAQSSEFVYADEDLLFDIVSKEKVILGQELGTTVKSVWKPTGMAPKLRGSLLFVLMSILSIYVFAL